MALRPRRVCAFPFLFGGAFIEATRLRVSARRKTTFPFLYRGAFIKVTNRVA